MSRSSTSPMPSRWTAASGGRWGIVASRTERISSLSCPSVPPIEIPSTPAAPIVSDDSRRRSSWTPPWTIPNTAWRPGPFSPCHSRQRSSQRWVRSIERAVYSRSAWNGVHSSKASAMSEPSCAWMPIDVSGLRKRSEPSSSDWNFTPCSLIFTTARPEDWPLLPLISSATPPWASENTWKPPESVMIGRSQPMKPCRPPWAAIRSSPGDRCR